MAELKRVACEAIDRVALDLNNISQELWKNPELNYNEHHAHTILTDFLENQGFHVERKYKLDTAFRATFGNDSAGPHVAVLCEYDALPEIGHACGHNLIAEVGVAAGVGIKAVMETSGHSIGKLCVLGTPAEEGGNGKGHLLKSGAFTEFDVVMMSHPFPYDDARPQNLISVDMAWSQRKTPTIAYFINCLATHPFKRFTLMKSLGDSGLQDSRIQADGARNSSEEGGGGKILLIDKHGFDNIDVAMMSHPAPRDILNPPMFARRSYYWQITVMGTPDEENEGGKLILLQKEAFGKVDVAIMSHPGPSDALLPNTMAPDWVTVTYKGKASHAAAFPWEGINALDAAVTCYQTVSCMRQQMKPTWRAHGIITKGGVRPNIIPEEASLEYYIRAPNRAELNVLREKIIGCFESAATATGCKVEYDFSDMPYLNVISNQALASSFETNAKELGLDFKKHGLPTDNIPLGSTDMGNVSYVVPSIHPFFYIGTDEVNHTRGFTGATGAAAAQPYTILQGKAMAMTAIDVFTNKDLLPRIKTEFDDEPQRKD